MSFAVLALLVVFGVVFANGLISDVSEITGSYSGYLEIYGTMDSYTLDAQVDVIIYWTNDSDNPATADAAPGSGAELQSVTATLAASATAVPWGSTFVYQVALTLDAPLTFDLGTVYWIAPIRPGHEISWYTIVGSTVRGSDCYLQYQDSWAPWPSQGQPATDMFHIIEGSTTSVRRATWGTIKNMF